jgi:hypothetical protein
MDENELNTAVETVETSVETQPEAVEAPVEQETAQ